MLTISETVLVTGGAGIQYPLTLGYIGSHVCVDLLHNGYNVVILDNLSNSYEYILEGIREITKRDFKFYQIDLQDKSELDQVFLENHIDYIIHLAGVKSVPESVKFPLFYYESNLVGLMNILEKVQATKSVKKIVFSSSAAVYGDVKDIKIVEDLECRPKSPYGSSKLFCEKILEDFCSMFKGSDSRHISVVVLRYFNPVGAHTSGMIGEHPIKACTGLMPLLEQVLTGQKMGIDVYGSDYDTKDGSCIRDFVHIMDIAAAHKDALKYDQQNGYSETFNIGSESGYTVLEIIKMLEKVSETNIPYKSVDRRSGDIGHIVANCEKANEKLNWKAEKSLEAMCIDLSRWAKKKPSLA